MTMTEDLGLSFLLTSLINVWIQTFISEVIWDINGTNVRMTLFCGDGTSKFVAKNAAGERFIVDEFKKKTVVVANEVSYSAKGFMSATRKQKQLSKNAL